ncbi:hypothetical protein OH76DRAFT_1134029 [Lentinus brumalis]|uniref:Uncharacterized protein n=1 Tax=Lentinus brumalis TaxID=2498619 RepID=A0A371CUL8_9APHY|nr:hypothetical protein OH76DRAFT_1134029 [Polyporus brumalis]
MYLCEHRGQCYIHMVQPYKLLTARESCPCSTPPSAGLSSRPLPAHAALANLCDGHRVARSIARSRLRHPPDTSPPSARMDTGAIPEGEDILEVTTDIVVLRSAPYASCPCARRRATAARAWAAPFESPVHTRRALCLTYIASRAAELSARELVGRSGSGQRMPRRVRGALLAGPACPRCSP